MIVRQEMTEIQSLARGLNILDLMGHAEDTVGVKEVSEHLGVDKSSASRLLQTLAHFGYVEQEEATRRYRLGPQVVALSRVLLNRMPLRDEAKPFIRQLVAQTGECAHLAILAQGQALYIDQGESTASLRVNNDIGTLSPLHCTALGKVLLAYSDMPVPESLPRFTQYTITDPAVLAEHLEQVRQQGYAVDDQEHQPDVRCIAAPVFDFKGKIVAAMGVSGPAARVSRDRLPAHIVTVTTIVQSLSDRLSFKR